MGFLTPITALSASVYSPTYPSVGLTGGVILYLRVAAEKQGHRLCGVLVVVATMFLASSHDDGMCGLPSPLCRLCIHHPPRLDRITAASLLFN